MTFQRDPLSVRYDAAAKAMIDRAIAGARRGRWVPGLIESPPGDPVEKPRVVPRPAHAAPGPPDQPRPRVAGRHEAPPIGSAAREATAAPYIGRHRAGTGDDTYVGRRRRLEVVEGGKPDTGPPSRRPAAPLTRTERAFQRSLYHDARIHKPRKNSEGPWSLVVEWGERTGRVRSLRIRVFRDTQSAAMVRNWYGRGDSYIKNPELRSTAALDRYEADR